MPPERRSTAGTAHGLHLARAQPEIESGLLSRQERCSFSCADRASDFVIHPEIVSRRYWDQAPAPALTIR